METSLHARPKPVARQSKGFMPADRQQSRRQQEGAGSVIP